LNTARRELGGAGDSQDAALAFNGNPGSAPETNVITESYNGSAWTEVNDMNTARSGGAGTGTQTAAIAFGGNLQPGNFQGTETWNGTSWTTVPGTLSRNPAGTLQSSGTVTSALAFSGSGPNALTELYNGTTWTEVNDLNTSRTNAAGTGADNTNAICMGGESPAVTGATETWNGTSWTTVTSLNTIRDLLASSGATNTAALAFGGRNPPTVYANTEEWNGSSWTETSDLNTARVMLSSSALGSTSSSLGFGGTANYTTQLSVTEEWTKPAFTPKTITQS